MKLMERTNVCSEPRHRRASERRSYVNLATAPTGWTLTAPTKRALALGVAAHMSAAVRGNQTPAIAFDGVRRSPEHPR